MRALGKIVHMSDRFDASEAGAAFGAAALFGLLLVGLWLTPGL